MTTSATSYQMFPADTTWFRGYQPGGGTSNPSVRTSQEFRTETLDQAANRHRQAVREVTAGVLLVVLGVVLTLATASAASIGGMYVIFFGPVILGAFNLFKGLADLG